jgi:serine phosphatase RsbU (regulator of sigma subunit)/anti-sigma regulatory factor (Ser/Thr protein kinase)
VAAGLTRARADVDAEGEQPRAIARAPARAAPAGEPSASILLVDDDEGGLRALHAVLEPLGQRLVAVRSGEEALRRLLREEFALILLDVRMPGLDGLQTARYIKTRARTRHIPIIFLTAHAEDVEHVFHAYAAGAVDYVVKPCDPDVLRSKVAVFVELQRERAERVREARGRAEAEAIAGTLQRHLLPDRLPEAPALALAARYRPSEQTAQVGGDWYDAILLPGGRVGLAIGDVVGHGVRAATLMAELRAALRAYAVTEPDSPGAALTLLNSLVARTHGREMVATLLYMVIDAGRHHARFASAGHPPPLLLDPGGGGVRMLEHQPVLPLGVAEHTRFESWEAELSPGATVLLYTDGLVERRGETIDTGLKRLCEALGDGPDGLEELCSHILTRAPGGRGAPDDTALLAARLLEPPATGSLELDLPAEPESVSVARHRLERWLTELGGGRDDVFALKLALSEVCANAVEHAYGPENGHRFRVRAERRERGAIEIEVSDEGQWRTPRGSQRGLGLSMSERLMDRVEIERTPRGTTVHMRKALT